MVLSTWLGSLWWVPCLSLVVVVDRWVGPVIVEFGLVICSFGLPVR